MIRKDKMFEQKISEIREQMIPVVIEKIKTLGGKISFRHYHSYEGLDRYSFYESNDGAYEIFLDNVKIVNDQPLFHLSDWEDSVDFEMGIKDFSAGGILDILTELENIEQFLEDYDETIVAEYDPDYEPEDKTLS